jgi:2-keto-4-pentenoate hydratase/2-oxohepta-3-ene-1,7-dioic acid hydratase in catechol pathway
MRILRLRHGGLEYFARQVDEATARLWTRAPWYGGTETDRLVPLRAEALLAPVTPTKVVCVGRNYRAHAAELGNEVPTEPLLFLKPPSAVVGPGAAIELPPQSQRVEHEGELGVVVGRRLRDCDAAEAIAAIAGLTCANDVTARDLQRKDVQFTRGKGFDTFCPVGPAVETELDPSDLALRVRVGREGDEASFAVRQEGRTRDMVFDVGTLLAAIAAVMTLEPGDLVLTGTPEGVGPLEDGDVVEVEVQGVGALRNPVRRRGMAARAASPS